jgi:hypothetical protein
MRLDLPLSYPGPGAHRQEALMTFTAGQRWSYRPPLGFEASRLVIGAIVAFDGQSPVICIAASGAPRRLPDGQLDAVMIPFLPLSQAAFAASVVALDGNDTVPPEFAGAFEAWSADPRGLSLFTVAFDGRLDQLIARQMTVLVQGQVDS